MGHGFSRVWSFRPFSDVQVIHFDRLEFAFFVPRVDACFRDKRIFRKLLWKGLVCSVRGLWILTKRCNKGRKLQGRLRASKNAAATCTDVYPQGCFAGPSRIRHKCVPSPNRNSKAAMTSSMILTPARVMTPVNETHTTHMKSMKTMSMKTKITAYMSNIQQK